MWGKALETGLKLVADFVLDGKKSKLESGGNYRVRGHINNFPIDFTVDQSTSGFNTNNTYNCSFLPSTPPVEYNHRGPYNHIDTINHNIRTMGSKNGKPSNKSSHIEPDSQISRRSMQKVLDQNINSAQKISYNSRQQNQERSEKYSHLSKGRRDGNDRQYNKHDFNVNKGMSQGDTSQRNNINKNFHSQNKKKANLNKNPGRTWMYVGRFKFGTTVADIEFFLKEKFPLYTFRVEQLPLYKNGKRPRFKVLVDNHILEDFEKPENWPQNIIITKFIHNFKT